MYQVEIAKLHHATGELDWVPVLSGDNKPLKVATLYDVNVIYNKAVRGGVDREDVRVLKVAA